MYLDIGHTKATKITHNENTWKFLQKKKRREYLEIF